MTNNTVISPVYPMLIQKYNTLIPDPNANVLDKINTIIDYLNQTGKLTNDVVNQWNQVMAWAMNDGLNTDVSNKLETMLSSGEFDSLFQKYIVPSLGDIKTLQTNDKTSTVNAINEVDQLAKTNQTNLGTLSSLTTTAKNNLVAAINENQGKIATNTANIGTLSNLQTTHKTDLVSAVNDNAASLADILTVKPSGSDDTTQIQNAINSFTNGGIVDFKDGDYTVNNGTPLTIPSNITLRARGKVRILSDNIIINVDSGSNNAANNIQNLKIEGIIFQSISNTFSQFVHLVALNGVSNVLIDRCQFIGFRGDGLYIGSSTQSNVERHNQNVKITNCLFDGINNQNRNGISVIDGDGVYIEKNVFQNCTASNMPGAIDLEPDANTYHILKNIHIRKNKFFNVGGNTGAINMNLPLSQSQMTVPVDTITIEGNTIDTTLNTQSGIQLVQAQTTAIDNTALGLNIKILNNKAKNLVGRGITLRGIKGATLSKNEIQNYASSSLIGYTGTGDKCVNIKVKDNVFKQGGTSDGYGLSIFTADRIDIIRNTFDDCGQSGGTYGVGLDFNNGTSSNVRLIGNDFITPTNLTKKAVQKETSHTLTPSTNIVKDNHLNGLGNDLQTSTTYNVDIQYEEGTWTPTIAGQTTAGSNTYSIQQGTYKRMGNMVVARCYVSLSALDAALAGNILIKGLPYASANIANTHTACAIEYQNVTFTANYSQLLAILYPNQTQIQLAQGGSGQAYAYLGQGNINSSTFFMVTATYFIA